MAQRGRKRKPNPKIPAHINQSQLPNNCYFEIKGRGHWYTTYKDERNKQRRKRIAGSGATLSELHRIIEEWSGIERDTFRWMCDQYFLSDRYLGLVKSTQKEYQKYFQKLYEIETKVNKPLPDIPLKRWDSFIVQKLVDKISRERGPTAAKHTHSFIRLVFTWGKNRGLCRVNPALGIELPKERKKQTLPTQEAYDRLLAHAKLTATHKLKVQGSTAYYIPLMMELEYLCKMRGVECRNLTDVHILDEGLYIDRRKGSRDTIVK